MVAPPKYSDLLSSSVYGSLKLAIKSSSNIIIDVRNNDNPGVENALFVCKYTYINLLDTRKINRRYLIG
jgi:hypothetical protein